MPRDDRFAYLMSAAEALLFVSDEPVSTAKLAEMLSEESGRVEEALALLAAEYSDENRGMQLREVAGGWRFYTHPAYHDLIESYVISWDTHRMSQAALEALAIIAYHQPVTRATINAIRGVNSDSVISSLVEKGLVREMGRDKPGGAILYGTTRAFLERFGLKSVKDLPPLEDFVPDDESREYIRERLSGAGKTDLLLDIEDDEDLLGEARAVHVVDDEGNVLVEEVDRGDDVREDDAEGVAAIIGQSMTEKVEDYLEVDIQDIDGILDEYFGDDEEDAPDEAEPEEDDDEEEAVEDEADDDDVFDAIEDESDDEAYEYFDDEDEPDDEDEDDDLDDDIQLVE